VDFASRPARLSPNLSFSAWALPASGSPPEAALASGFSWYLFKLCTYLVFSRGLGNRPVAQGMVETAHLPGGVHRLEMAL
jgi:hypothetical protein